MTTDAVPGDPRRLLSEVRDLAHRVRRDQRVTWVALLVLAVVTFAAIPFDWFGMEVRCAPTGECEFSRDGVLYYWPPALLMAYAAIAYAYRRVARSRGVEARVLPYAITGAALILVFLAAWVAVRVYLADNPPPAEPLAYGWMVLDRLVAPWGIIGVALLVLARLERNTGLLLFTLGYLAVVLVPIDFGWQAHQSVPAEFVPQQVINGLVLLLGAAGFALARRR
ncbi:hypothetical protein [Actinoplanes flavus]|uniref:Uncharacterized protein n=1 Tax=Actinoplanes flavus TaxID=2820290 RepID=A0ABS3UF19_9ACTN|nr:hypothetical protein [Actinoplanes flavus]MBO3737365.1 hypothetical protein [Actinoplanes flavus]